MPWPQATYVWKDVALQSWEHALRFCLYRLQSYLVRDEKNARFYGDLDIKTLGGAGFASQRTVSEETNWDLSGYAGIQLDIAKGDSKYSVNVAYLAQANGQDFRKADSYTEKRYTLILKDTLLSRNPENGREQATISWECDFDLPPQTVPGDAKDKVVFIPWSALNPTYRGKLEKDAEPIVLKKIKRFSIMMRRWSLQKLRGYIFHKRWPSSSFFGTQEGEFSLTLKSIKAVSHAPPPAYAQTVAKPGDVGHGQPEKHEVERPVTHGLWRYLPAALLAVHLAALGAFVFIRRCWAVPSKHRPEKSDATCIRCQSIAPTTFEANDFFVCAAI
jgi:hypothetical protein